MQAEEKVAKQRLSNLELSLAHPAWVCVRLSDNFKLEDISVSLPTIRNILIKNGMDSKYDRWLKLEQKRVDEARICRFRNGLQGRGRPGRGHGALMDPAQTDLLPAQSAPCVAFQLIDHPTQHGGL